MITVFDAVAGRVARGGVDVLAGSLLWIDLLNPSREEEVAVEALLGIDIPTREELQEIEVSSRLFRDGDILFLTTPILANSSSFNPRNEAVTFILTGSCLVSVRYETPQALTIILTKLEGRDASLRPTTPADLLLAILEAVIDRLADVLQRIGLELDSVSQRTFHQPLTTKTPRRRPGSRELEALLRTIGRNGDLSAKGRESLLGLKRLLAFLPDAGDLKVAAGPARIKVMDRDLQSLSEYTDFLNTKTGFLLDATLGMINIQQNNIIKLFSVVAVLFVPPTLVASWYGMNFRHIPELDWAWGYPYAIVLAVASAVLPYWIFKRKGWL